MHKMKQQTITDKAAHKICLISSIILFYNSLYGQCLISENTLVIYKYDSTSIKYSEFVIKNDSKDTLYLWIDSDTLETNLMTPEQANQLYFIKYLRAPKCELGLEFLCNDKNINYGDVFPPDPVIGCTFIKRIIPDAFFQIIAMGENIKKEFIHYVSKEFVMRFFRNNRLDVFCYDKSFIVVW